VSGSAYDEARESWGFPRFAADFPRHEELDALVVAFARGDYATVRERAPELAKRADDEAVRRAAERLAHALTPDPGAKILFGLAAALLVFLTVWWLGHDRPAATIAAPPPPPAVEIVR
jgi:hypothetical protein